MTAPTDLAPSLDFFARRFLATTAELNVARGRLAAVDALIARARAGHDAADIAPFVFVDELVDALHGAGQEAGT